MTTQLQNAAMAAWEWFRDYSADSAEHERQCRFEREWLEGLLGIPLEQGVPRTPGDE